MSTLQVLPVPGLGTEDVVVALAGPDEGCVYTGTEDGAVWRVSHDGRRIDRVAETGGRPLGIELEPDGRLLVCDAHRGLLRVDPRTGGVEAVADHVDGRRMLLVDNAAVAGDGTIWFSDSSTHYELADWKDDFVLNTRTGRLLRHDPDGTTTAVVDGLAFANGVALAADGSWVAVAESGARTVVRLWLSGEEQGTREFLVEGLPGYPDNIALGSDGLLWVTIATPTDPSIERLLSSPLWLRTAVTWVPERLQPQPKKTLRVQAYDASVQPGRLVHDLDLTGHPAASGAGGGFSFVTGVREHEGRVWLGSLAQSAIAVVDL